MLLMYVQRAHWVRSTRQVQARTERVTTISLDWSFRHSRGITSIVFALNPLSMASRLGQSVRMRELCDRTVTVSSARIHTMRR